MAFDARALLLLTRIPGLGPVRIKALVGYFGSPAAVLQASPYELIHVEGIEKKTAVVITDFRKAPARAEAEKYVDAQLRQMQKANANLVTLWDDAYPASLKKIYDPPALLFIRGAFDPMDVYSIAIVGTREPSAYGVHIAERFGTEIARAGLPVVSGLAKGIDTCAHGAALRAHGRTIAVIGSGVDAIYPSENDALASRISCSGAVVSEYDMGAKPDAQNFPRRNRIISGIALATLVVETGIDGGAMITASTALDQNREVFAIPSALHETRKSGTNKLIKEGKAMLTESIDDILQELAPRLRGALTMAGSAPREAVDLSLFEQQVYDALDTDTPLHIDALAVRAGMPTTDALVHLLGLELKGVVRQLPGKMFLRM